MTDEQLKNNAEENVAEETEPTNESASETKSESKKEKKDKYTKHLEHLQLEVKKAQEEAASWKDKYYRVYADMDNQKKQYAKEYQQAIKYQSQSLAEKLLPSFEMFSMVVESSDKLPPEVQSYVVGFDMVYRQMIQALESEDIREIKANIGDVFDHKLHYAMETEEVADEKMIDKIVRIIRKGYMIHDRLLKPVTVVVGKKKEVKEENQSQDEEKTEE